MGWQKWQLRVPSNGSKQQTAPHEGTSPHESDKKEQGTSAKKPPKSKKKSAPPKGTSPRDVDGAQGQTLKRPAAAMSAEAMRRSTKPSRPQPSMTPTPYLGGRIYYLKKEKRLRVYRRYRQDNQKSDVRIKVDFDDENDVAQAWAHACSVIENDPRPAE